MATGNPSQSASAVLLAEHADLPGIVRPALDRIGHGFAKDIEAVQVEQLAGFSDHAAHVAGRLDPALDEDVDAGRRRAESIAPRRRKGRALASHNLRPMIGRFQLLPQTPAAPMLGDHGLPVEQRQNLKMDTKHGKPA